MGDIPDDDSFNGSCKFERNSETEKKRRYAEDNVADDDSMNESVHFDRNPGATPPPQPPPMHLNTPNRGAMEALAKRAAAASAAGPSTSAGPSKRPRCGALDPIRSFVFFDLETTGLFPQGRIPYKTTDALSTSEQLRDHLASTIGHVDVSFAPHITELSCVSVTRECFRRSAQQMHDLHVEGRENVSVCAAANVLTCQIKPKLCAQEWRNYEQSRKTIKAIRLSRMDLEEKRGFEQEWEMVRAWLDAQPKPCCIVAHNGAGYDFLCVYQYKITEYLNENHRVLQAELRRAGLLAAALPDGCVWVDSLIAVRAMDAAHREKTHATVRDLDWSSICELASPAKRPPRMPMVEEQAEDGEGDMFDTPPVHALTAIRPPAPQVTPPRPPPQHTTMSEPAKLTSRRRLFVSGDDLPAGHPLLFFNTDMWTTARSRRIRPQFFIRRTTGEWEFDDTLARVYFRNENGFGLAPLYRLCVASTGFLEHQAQSDCEATLQVCLSFGNDFLAYADSMAAEFPF